MFSWFSGTSLALGGIIGLAGCGASEQARSPGSGAGDHSTGGVSASAGTSAGGPTAGQAQSNAGSGPAGAAGVAEAAGEGGAAGAAAHGGSSRGGSSALGGQGGAPFPAGGGAAAGQAGQCGLGETTFVLKPAAGAPDGAFCLDESQARFLSIKPKGGEPLNAFACNPQECETPCESVFGGCLPARPLPPVGTRTNWRGTSLESRMSAACNRSCDVPVCVAPGTYTVTMCASLTVVPMTSDGTCTGGDSRCVSIDFDVPLSESVIAGEISP